MIEEDIAFDLELGVDGNIIMNVATMSLMLVPSMQIAYFIVVQPVLLVVYGSGNNINAST